MAIKYPDTFMDSLPAGFDGVFDWDFLIPAFAPTKIQPMDIDGIIERKGRFIVFETKNGDTPVPLGQKITLEALVKTRLFVVIILRAKTPDKIRFWEAWWWEKGAIQKEIFHGNSTALVAWCRHWFDYANSQRGTQ